MTSSQAVHQSSTRVASTLSHRAVKNEDSPARLNLRESEKLLFRELFERGSDQDEHPGVTQSSSEAPVNELLTTSEFSSGILDALPFRSCHQPGTQISASGPLSQSQGLDMMLDQFTKDVSLASDGRDRFALRFRLDQGELRGAQITVFSDCGVISAVAVQGPAFDADATFQLERSLETAWNSLEEKGIVCSDLEVRTHDDPQRDDHYEGREDEHPLDGRDLGSANESNGHQTREDVRGRSTTIDYFV